jgi:DNA repair protein RecN (Recombination protein N)
MDTPEVWFSSNPGSPLLPLTKVASGGERARFMLALKSVLASIQSTPVVILDEIDTGVSGEVASHMGKAMRDIAGSDQTQQVLAVTHLPQVAALASKHWEVSKFTDGATTHVTVEALDTEGRQRAIASMLSGSDITEEALGQAARLLTSS